MIKGRFYMINKFRYLIKNQFVRSFEKKDIRSPQEYAEGNLEGSISIPEYELKNKVKNKLLDKEQTIIVYCSTGTRSKKAQKKLEKMGYSNVYNLHGGLENEY